MESSLTVIIPNATTPASAHTQVYEWVINIVWSLLICAISLVSNLFILIVVFKNKKLQTPCYLLICGDCVCSLFLTISCFSNIVHQICAITGSIDKYNYRITCYASFSLVNTFGYYCSTLITCCIAGDRLFCLLYPLPYRRMGLKHVYGCLVCSFGYSAMASVAGMFIGPMYQIVECVDMFTPMSLPYLAYYSCSNTLFSIVCVLEYAAVLLTFKWRKRRVSLKNQGDLFMTHQMACVPVVKLLIAMYTVTNIVPELCISVISASKCLAVYTSRVTRYAGILKMSSFLIHIVALLVASNEFRKCAKATIRSPPRQSKNNTQASSGKFGTSDQMNEMKF